MDIPTAIPLVYEFDENIKAVKHYYLADPEELQKKIDAVKNQAKADKPTTQWYLSIDSVRFITDFHKYYEIRMQEYLQNNKSKFHIYREKYQPRTPQILNKNNLQSVQAPAPILEQIAAIFPTLTAKGIHSVTFKEAEGLST